MNILYLLLLFPKLLHSADPLESLIRNGWLMIRDYGEKMISNIAIPRTSDIPEDVASFQLDPEKKKALETFSQILNTCPQGFPIQELKGLWHVTHVSERMLYTTFSDIHDAIEKLSSGKSISSRKSLFSLFQADPVMRCFQLTVLDDSTASPFEFVYHSTDNRRKSIIGSVSRPSSTQLSLQIASTIDLPFRSVHVTSGSLILSQTDTIPTSCDSFLVLQRNPGLLNDPGLDQILTSFGANSVSNPIVKMTHCNENSSTTTSSKTTQTHSIIRPASQPSFRRLLKL